MTTKEIEYYVALHFGIRKNNIVPNISWGLGIHECDLLIVPPNRYAIEVEIKISISDLKADAKKWHKHNSELIRNLYFAIPTCLYEKAEPLIPENAGILVVDEYGIVDLARGAHDNPNAIKISDAKLLEILRLGNMRTWSLRKKLLTKDELKKIR